MEQFGVSLMEVVWFVVFLVCCLVVGLGEKWNKGIDRYEVGMLWYSRTKESVNFDNCRLTEEL